MKQIRLATTGFELTTKRTRKREFLDEIDRVIPLSELLALIVPYASSGKTGRSPFAPGVMFRIHLIQQFFGHSDPAMEEALHDEIPLQREFARLDVGMTCQPDESTILRFRHLLEAHDVGVQILAAANAHDVTQAGTLLHGQLIDAFAKLRYRRVRKREEVIQAHPDVAWHVAMMSVKRKALDKTTPMVRILDALDKTKARIRAKVEHPFRIIKCQFGHLQNRPDRVKKLGPIFNTDLMM